MTRVTVLIPARNGAKTLAQTLDSLVSQSCADFKVLLVDDASSDGTAALGRSYAGRLEIEVLSLETNAGVAGALNRGLARIDTELVMRLDADDIAMPTRVAKQLAFLDANPQVDVCSSWMEMFYDAPGHAPALLAKPVDDAAIKTAMIQYCAISHPAIMLRKSFFDDVGLYDVRFDFAEDYDLWCRGALLGKCFANLPEALTRYRQHDGQVGKQKQQLQYERDMLVKRKYLGALLGGQPAGHLPEFFSLITRFTTPEIAVTVLQQSMPLLLALGRKIHDPQLFGEIVAACIGRHLRT